MIVHLYGERSEIERIIALALILRTSPFQDPEQAAEHASQHYAEQLPVASDIVAAMLTIAALCKPPPVSDAYRLAGDDPILS